jgi:hypothetical protein
LLALIEPSALQRAYQISFSSVFPNGIIRSNKMQIDFEWERRDMAEAFREKPAEAG